MIWSASPLRMRCISWFSVCCWAICSKRAELETLNEQIAQQKTENEEMQRILSGDADQITEWVARDSYNYAAPNERIFVDVTGS